MSFCLPHSGSLEVEKRRNHAMASRESDTESSRLPGFLAISTPHLHTAPTRVCPEIVVPQDGATAHLWFAPIECIRLWVHSGKPNQPLHSDSLAERMIAYDSMRLFGDGSILKIQKHTRVLQHRCLKLFCSFLGSSVGCRVSTHIQLSSRLLWKGRNLPPRCQTNKEGS